MRVVTELTRDDTVAQQVTTDLLRRPDVARKTMRDDTTRMLVNRAQFDNSNEGSVNLAADPTIMGETSSD
ncbi:DUF6192 family protein [Streptomyces sp. NPDC087425]|uniref:DUF6192 family protein n=1 Tax=Streptomyces sp. NPDC087425 TaxID=3365787 RepID=UPI003809AB04